MDDSPRSEARAAATRLATPPSGRRKAAQIPLWIALGLFVLSGPCVLLGVFGLFGVMADVSIAENRQMGWQLLRIASVPAGVGLIVLIAALTFRGSKRRALRNVEKQ